MIKHFWLKKQKRRFNSKSIYELIEESSLPFYHNFLPALNKELSRIRRFEHPLSIVVMQPNGVHLDKADKYKQKADPRTGISQFPTDIKSTSKAEFVLCGLIVKNSIRDIDMIAYDNLNNRFILSFPETNKAQANQSIKRLKKLIGNSMAGQLCFGIAEFPENGLIIEDLIEHANFTCNSHTNDMPPVNYSNAMLRFGK